MTNMTFSEELEWRGFVNQTTIKDLDYLNKNKICFYHGFDASADSQTIGNLAGMMVDLCFLRHGHKGIILAGGATSLVGDPGGKDKERPLQTEEIISQNIEKAKIQIQKIFGVHEFTIVNNIDWIKDKNIIFFLREIGKYFNVGEMIKKEYIAARLGEGAAGISFTEFSYELLQGYDFLHLFEKYNCTLQIGGADQWTNCLAGTELIRRKLGKESHVLTLPLVINKATGKKFGKSEAGAVWLDSQKTSVYDFYQFWINTDDEGCRDYVKIYTQIEKSEYEDLLKEAEESSSKRIIQKYLAYEVTKLVHGTEEADKAKETSESLFGGGKVNTENLETFELTSEFISENKIDLVNFLATSGVLKSKREARDLIAAGGIYIDDIATEKSFYDLSQLKDAKEFLLRVGKKKYYKVVMR
jgi:tyrosyl-tRNA synthetase